jgi:hypothetical protein
VSNVGDAWGAVVEGRGHIVSIGVAPQFMPACPFRFAFLYSVRVWPAEVAAYRQDEDVSDVSGWDAGMS